MDCACVLWRKHEGEVHSCALGDVKRFVLEVRTHIINFDYHGEYAIRFFFRSGAGIKSYHIHTIINCTFLLIFMTQKPGCG